MAQRKKRYLLAVALLLAAALALMIFYGLRKQGYHVDELYTYELTNYPGGFYALQEGYLDTWQQGSLYESALHPARAFDYAIPWNNQKIDVHPPLYYCVVYTFECLFPGMSLPWVGILPNFLCLLGGAFALYWAARRMTGRFWVSWVAAAVFLLNIGSQGMAVFTRMYALLMLETVLLVLAHLTLYRQLLAGQTPPLGISGAGCGHPGRGADPVFLPGVLFLLLRPVRAVAAVYPPLEDRRPVRGGGVRRAGAGLPRLPHHEAAHLLGVPGQAGPGQLL